MVMEPDDLESLIHRELARLPRPEAPRSLVTRVMAAVATAEQPWYRRGWRTWPVAWQAASIAACAVFLAASALSLPVAQDAAMSWAAAVFAHMTGEAAPIAPNVIEAWRATAVIWRVLVGPAAAVAFVPVLAMLATTLALGAAVGRLALGRTTFP